MDHRPNPRIAAADVEPLFVNRWSPRSFSGEPLTDGQVAALFEAARWAPSSFNRQPWLFLYETDGPDRPLFDSILLPVNRAWAERAPLIGFIFANTRTADGKRPRTAQFDTGAAWMSLALQATARGIHVHGMAGIDHDAAYAKLGMDARFYTVMCGFVAGRIGPPDALPAELREREYPNDRKPTEEVARRGALRPGPDG